MLQILLKTLGGREAGRGLLGEAQNKTKQPQKSPFKMTTVPRLLILGSFSFRFFLVTTLFLAPAHSTA